MNIGLVVQLSQTATKRLWLLLNLFSLLTCFLSGMVVMLNPTQVNLIQLRQVNVLPRNILSHYVDIG